MKLYKYVVKNKSGELVTYIDEADGFEELCHLASERNEVIVRYRKLYRPFYKISCVDKLALLKHIKLQYINSVSLVKAIENFIKISDNLFFIFQLKKILKRIKSGDTLQDSFTGVFDAVLSGFLLSLETTGNFIASLDAMVEYIETSEMAEKRLRRHLQYPLFILLVISVVVFGFVKFLLPTLEEISGKNLLFEWLYPVYLFFILILTCFGLCCFFSEEFLAKNPITSSIVIRINNWYFAVTLYINLKAKLLFLQAFQNSILSISNAFIRQEFLDIFYKLNNGLSLSESISGKLSMSKRLREFITLGEVNNNFLLMLNAYNNFEKEAILAKINSIGMALSISILILSGLLLMFILIGVFFPMYQTLFGLDSLRGF